MSEMRYFIGRVALSRLGHEDLAAVAGAFAMLEKLATAGVLSFRVGHTREAAKAANQAPKNNRRHAQQDAILATLRDLGPRGFDALRDVLDMKEGALSASLSALVARGDVLKTVAAAPDGRSGPGRPSRARTSYSAVD
jgi:hypothetical protein